MKRTIISSVAAVLLLIATEAPAAPIQEASSKITPSSAGQDITRITVTDNGSSFTFDIYLHAPPSSADHNTQYNVYIGSLPTLLEKASFLLSPPFKVQIGYSAAGGFVAQLLDSSHPSAPVTKRVTVTPTFSGAINRLECVISKNDLAAVPCFMGTTERDSAVIDRTTVAATPIPAVAWLFASGILCLIGLKRKQLH